MKKIFILSLWLACAFSAFAATPTEQCLEKKHALTNCGLTDDDMPDVIQYYQANPTNYISLGYNHFTDKGLSQLIQHIQFTEISLAGNQITDAGAAILSRVPNLFTVNLADNRITDEGGMLLATVPTLNSLNLSKTSITRKTIAAIAKNHYLYSIALEDIGLYDQDILPLQSTGRSLIMFLRGNHLSDAGVSILMTNYFQYLDLSQNDIGDEGAITIAKRRGLGFFPLLAYNHITDIGAIAFTRYNQGESFLLIDLEGNQLTDKAAEAFASMRVNEPKYGDEPFGRLSIGNNKMTLQGIKKIINAISFNEGVLYLNNSHYGDEVAKIIGQSTIKNISLKGNDITDAGVAALMHNPQLSVLLLEDNKITDEGFKLLLNIPAYHYLALARNQLTNQSMHDLFQTQVHIKKLTIRGNQLTEDIIQSLDTHPQIGEVCDK
jgi:hypothetical protein